MTEQLIASLAGGLLAILASTITHALSTRSARKRAGEERDHSTAQWAREQRARELDRVVESKRQMYVDALAFVSQAYYQWDNVRLKESQALAFCLGLYDAGVAESFQKCILLLDRITALEGSSDQLDWAVHRLSGAVFRLQELMAASLGLPPEDPGQPGVRFGLMPPLRKDAAPA